MSVNDVIATLKRMDERQLIQLFEDMEDVQLVKDIANCANYYVENYREPALSASNDERDDWRKEDDKRRYNDYKSDNRDSWL